MLDALWTLVLLVSMTGAPYYAIVPGLALLWELVGVVRDERPAVGWVATIAAVPLSIAFAIGATWLFVTAWS